ncbi:MAG: class I adenylate-forming enzyme family protein [Caldimonas sp.]
MTDPIDLPYQTLAERIREHAAREPGHLAVVDAATSLDYAGLDALMDRVAVSLQRAGIAPGEAIAICAASSVRYAAVFLGALRAGVVVAPLAPSVTPASFASMLADARARLLFVDAAAIDLLADAMVARPPLVALDAAAPGTRLDDWLAAASGMPDEASPAPNAPFNIIYSSGTTGAPKGIVQSHGMRWSHVSRGSRFGYGTDTVTLLATPLYSNTTLVAFFPTLALGGTVVLMAKFDAETYLALAERHRATHTMLVPVQYQRVMANPGFASRDLSTFRFKFCTSAPFSAALKADVVARWPGALIEYYGMTEGGGTCILAAHEHPTKLHTVGQPAEGHDIRLIDEAGRELPPGSTGEVVGHSPGMMTGYFGQPLKTAEAEWFDASGKRFIRTGDVGRFDDEGFLTLLDRRKDMIISGGFNVFPSDLEAVLREHPAVAEAAVAGVPSQLWGETPVAWVVLRGGEGEAGGSDAESLRAWANERLGKMQRITALRFIAELPRSAIGKVLKRELRDSYDTEGTPP